MSKLNDLTGMKFGRLTVVKRMNNNKNFQSMWLCKCDCGNETTVIGTRLNKNLTKSCGCLNREISTTHHMSGSKIYGVWQNMKNRCYKEYSTEFKRYGLRGIKVCDKWQDFEGFYDDMSAGYIEGLSIDRIDNNGNYELSNCRWTDNVTQQNNRRISTRYAVNGITETFANLCRIFGINYDAAKARSRRGWDMEKIFTTSSKAGAST